MGKKASSTIKAGSLIQVKEGVCLPEFPEVSCAGWTGIVEEVKKKDKDRSYTIIWDETTEKKIPEAYKAQCEAQQLLYNYACLPGDDLILADSQS
ncbi:hypothetical protein [Gimesia panareensis]|uniref:Uncharacterized protein n=1 Tax=Gimesia panareensis TaxID=2527978 RepID=A0A518A6P0_9PLAN|nr:hypothetical protein [Gimesia panareensis]QDU50398.1 hypothetical protein Pan110_27440 [Gimesia panareensis]QDV16304.1 hypothetical protein Pan153_09310 [Gimesia panareensis]